MGQEEQLKKMQEQQQQQAQMEEQKRVMIHTILEPDARERLNRIGIVKPERKLQLEAQILALANAGGMQEKLSETALIALSERIDGEKKATTGIKFQRKRQDDDEDDIDLDNL